MGKLTDVAASVRAQVVIEEDEGASPTNLLKEAGEEVDPVTHGTVSPAGCHHLRGGALL